MATTFPTTIDSYTTKVNNVDTITAGHVNDLQDAMVQVETILGASSARRTSWTPTLTFETPGTSSVTYDTANTGGWYAQFGSIIYMIGRIDLASLSLGSASGNVIISLPVASLSGNFSLASILVNTSANWTTLFPAIGRVAAGASTMRLYSYAAATGHTVLTTANVGADSQMIFSGFYFHA